MEAPDNLSTHLWLTWSWHALVGLTRESPIKNKSQGKL